MNINSEFYVQDSDKNIFKLVSMRELQSKILGFLYSFEFIAGYDYINPDYNDIQGYVEASGFVGIHEPDITVFYDESLADRLIEEEFTVLKSLPKIHEFKGDLE